MEKVFIYSPYTHWSNDPTTVNFITAIFKHKGYQVNTLNCSGILNMCAIRNPYFAGGLAQMSKDRVCTECRSRQVRYRFLKPHDFHTIEDYVDMHSCLIKAKEIQEEKCTDSLLDIEFEGLRLYDQIQSSLNTYFRSTNLK